MKSYLFTYKGIEGEGTPVEKMMVPLQKTKVKNFMHDSLHMMKKTGFILAENRIDALQQLAFIMIPHNKPVYQCEEYTYFPLENSDQFVMGTIDGGYRHTGASCTLSTIKTFKAVKEHGLIKYDSYIEFLKSNNLPYEYDIVEHYQ